MQLRAVIFLLSLTAAIHGIVLFNTEVTNPLTSLPSGSHSSPPDCRGINHKVRTTAPRVTTKVFRNQYKAKQNAIRVGQYVIAHWDKGVVAWKPMDTISKKPIPASELVVADHVFELQMLTKWLNELKVELKFNLLQLAALKEVINGRENAVYIGADLNCVKASFVDRAMEKALAGNFECPERSPGPLSSYIKAVANNLDSVLDSILRIILDASDRDWVLTKNFSDVAGAVIKCMKQT